MSNGLTRLQSRFLADPCKLFLGHLRIGFVVESDDVAAFVVVACGADESCDRTGFRIADEINQLLQIYRFIRYAKHLKFGIWNLKFRAQRGSTAAHRRNNRDFIAVV